MLTTYALALALALALAVALSFSFSSLSVYPPLHLVHMAAKHAHWSMLSHLTAEAITNHQPPHHTGRLVDGGFD